MKKILVIKTGGTIGSVEQNGIVGLDRALASTVLPLLAGCEDFSDSDFCVISPLSILSENITACDMQKIAREVLATDSENYSGIIITHGTDTLAFSACFLALALSHVQIPVVLVSANFPLSNHKSNAKTNFITACRFIRNCQKSGDFPKNGVFVSYQNIGEPCKILPASRLSQCRGSIGTFLTHDSSCVAIASGKSVLLCPEFQQPILQINSSNLLLSAPPKNVLLVTLHPFLNFNLFNLTSNPPDAIVVELFHSGTARTAGENSLLDFCKLADTHNIPVALAPTSQSAIYQTFLPLKNLKNVTLSLHSIEMTTVMLAFDCFPQIP